MRDEQEIMMKFVKIVQRHPEVYNTSMDSYRTRCVLDKAWEEIANEVKTEINEDCTAEEVKIKWKGIRSSFNRYKNKLYQTKYLYNVNPCKKYYLYDVLRFLDPFTKPKGIYRSNQLEDSYNESDFCVEYIEDNNTSEEYEGLDIKPDVTNLQNDSTDDPYEPTTSKRIRTEQEEESEDMQFFKSIMPDIKKFTSKEKRKLKKGILQLIDEIEDDRKNRES